MKNIFLLPTTDKTRLFTSDSELILAGYPSTTFKTGVNLYITSNEKLKEEDWFLKDNKPIRKSGHIKHYAISEPKIVLTTDVNLIKKGVQNINDEFLEWFIENTNCNFVEVKEGIVDWEVGLELKPKFAYKITIPIEKPVNPNNQEIMFHEERQEYFHEDFIDGKKITVWLGNSFVEHKSTETQETELFNAIYYIIKQLPIRRCEGDCMDVISCSQKIEELFHKYNQK